MANHQTYYVPAQSKWPIIASIALLLLVFGGGSMMNGDSAGAGSSLGRWLFFAGALLTAWMMFGWFSNVVKESREGLYSPQMDRSFRMGMGWFIFSEVMFFAAFFGALFYVRTFAGPWLGGEGDKGLANMLWPDFTYQWPLMVNPDPKTFPGPSEVISAWQLPLINTLILLTSSTTVTWAHHALLHNDRRGLITGLALTVALGVLFSYVQYFEYVHAPFAFAGVVDHD